MDFAEGLRKIRHEKRLSQQELADKLGVAQSTVGMWESGKRTPKIAELNRLARTLNIAITRLLDVRKEKKIEIEKGEIYIDGKKIQHLNKGDVEGIIEYIESIKKGKGKSHKGPSRKMGSAAKKVLIIDDERKVCETLYSFLTPHNYRVFLAFNGQMGLEYLENIKPDIVLLDIKMPDIDGVEVLKVIRKVSKVPVLVITAHPQEISEIHLADLKIEGYIEKPINLDAVLNTLKHIIGE